MRGLTFAATAALLVAAGCAQSSGPRDQAVFSARNGFVVHPIGENRFEVIGRGSAAGRSYFCAAGDYAIRRLGAQPNDRVTLIEPVGPAINNPGGRSAKFELTPPGSGSTSLVINTRRAGQSLRAEHARTNCNRELPGFFGSS